MNPFEGIPVKQAPASDNLCRPARGFVGDNGIANFSIACSKDESTGNLSPLYAMYVVELATGVVHQLASVNPKDTTKSATAFRVIPNAKRKDANGIEQRDPDFQVVFTKE